MDLDYNKVAAELVNTNISSLTKKAFGLTKEKIDQFKVTFGLCYRKYIAQSAKRHIHLKTILNRLEPSDIRDVYVTSRLDTKNGVIRNNILKTLFNKLHNKWIVNGTAGCGKSTLIKYIFLELVTNKVYGIPFLVELRNLNDEELSIEEYIHSELVRYDDRLTEAQLRYSLKSGNMILLLDGYDELDFNKRSKYYKDIDALSITYPETAIIVSGRPDDSFSGWNGFTPAKIMPLTKNDAVELIRKLDYDKELKNKFIDELNNDLYNNNKDFASNPLLLTIMLLTYESLARIPNSMHLFYDQAFSTLYYKHDACKQQYRRKTYTGLPIDKFKKALSAFSASTYLDNKVSFLDSEIYDYLEKTKKLSNIEFEKGDFLEDLLESVCVLTNEGLHYVYTHRSFQEYFTALFIINCATDKKFELIDTLVKWKLNDNVLSIAKEMDSDMINQNWTLPVLNRITTEFEKTKKSDDYYAVKIASLFYCGIQINKDTHILYAELNDTNLFPYYTIQISQLYNICKQRLTHFISASELKKLYHKNKDIDEELTSFYPPTKTINDILIDLKLDLLFESYLEEIYNLKDKIQSDLKIKKSTLEDILLNQN